MEFKSGSGWRCCCDPETGLYTAETGGGPNHDLYEITKEIYDHIDDPGVEWPVGMIHKWGRHLYMTVNDRCGPPYTVILDTDYKRLCPLGQNGDNRRSLGRGHDGRSRGGVCFRGEQPSPAPR